MENTAKHTLAAGRNTLADDVKDWHKNLNKVELNLLTQIFRFFTQSDVEVSNAYVHLYSKVFRPIEIQMMLNSFANMESIHIASYSHLLDTVGMPEVEYSAFLKYKQMKDKHEYLQNFNVENNFEIAKSIAVFSAFTEGLQLFASFAILLNFPRHNKMKGMGQIVTFSVRDETLHIQSMIRVFKTFISEHPEVWNNKLKNEIYKCCEDVIKLKKALLTLHSNLVILKTLPQTM